MATIAPPVTSIPSASPTSVPISLTPNTSPSKPPPTATSPSKHIFPSSSPSKSSQSPLTSPVHNPTKPKFEPNPHPYAIKTTSTALLARSNSSSHNISAHKHTYVPPSPSAAPPSPTHNRNNNSSGGHKYTRSLTGVQDIPVLPPGTLGNATASSSPRPLPVPPGAASASTPSLLLDTVSPTPSPPRRAKRSETLPVLPSTPPPPPPAFNLDDLPENPKLWTPSQLSAYLTTALRLRASEGESEVRLPERVANDVAAFVRQARIGGRAFLRLNEADLEGMGVNKLWRTALLSASRNLRQNILKGRIWPSPTSSPVANSDSDQDIRAPMSTESLYSNTLYASSDSSLSSAGEVEDIVATPFTKAKRSRVKVRERVRDFEERSRSRSASEVSESEAGNARKEAKIERVKRVKSRPLPMPPMPSVSPVPPHSASASPSPKTRRQLPRPPFSFSDNENDEEPTMEALLASQDKGTWGARAWEEIDEGLGIITVKHVPGEGEEVGMGIDGERMKGTISRGTGKAKERGRGRVVTSIFQGLDENGQGVPRESSGEVEVDEGKDDVVAMPVDLELRTATRDVEIQSPVVATADAEVQSPVIATTDAEVQSSTTLTADAEVQSPVLVTTDAEVQSPAVQTVEVEVQSLEPEEDRKLEGAIQELERKLETSRGFIEEFKKRLEGVEKEIEGMGAAEAERERRSGAPSPSSSVSSSPTTTPDNVARRARTRVGLATSLVSRLFGLVGLSSSSDGADLRREREMDVGDLPSYVFLVGLGVCAVVLKVLVKRVRRGLR